MLEQRIGRVHRIGQSRGVQVIDFVGQGSIETGMLGVLALKKLLFSGELDGGQSEVFLEGTRLSQFMKSGEQVTGAICEADADPGPDAAAVASATDSAAQAGMPARPRAAGRPAPAEPADHGAAILESGAAVLQGLASVRTAGGASPCTTPRCCKKSPRLSSLGCAGPQLTSAPQRCPRRL